MQDKWDFLPGMKRWDGIPHYDFVKIWIAALIVALGSIVQGVILSYNVPMELTVAVAVMTLLRTSVIMLTGVPGSLLAS
jgi:hypothetical protein